MWKPNTFEDILLAEYLEENTGDLFLEVPVGLSGGRATARRIDAVLVPGDIATVHPPGDYSRSDVEAALRGRDVHVIEAKRTLNRAVIGQTVAGAALLQREFDPAGVEKVAVCGAGHPDLEWVCKKRGIAVFCYPVAEEGGTSEPKAVQGEAVQDRADPRSEPDEARRRAFLGGWTDAVKGTLYQSVRTKKSHANMGNLFGWIYGDQPREFRIETWERYVRHAMDRGGAADTS